MRSFDDEVERNADYIDMLNDPDQQDEHDVVLHQPTVSGLWSHSHDPEFDLMKQYVVFKKLFTADGKPNGFNAMRSFDTFGTALLYTELNSQFSGIMRGNEYRIEDQFNGNKVVYA